MSLNKQITYLLSTILLMICGCITLFAQSPDSLVQRQRTLSGDSVVVLKNAIRDTLITTPPDSLTLMDLERDTTLISPPDSLSIIMAETDTTGISKLEGEIKGMLERPAFSSAKDSVIEDFTNGRKLIYYFGDVTMKYGDLSLKADYISYDMDKNVVFARGTRDTITGELIGIPEMTDRGNTYRMEEVYYNFTSKKAKIKNMTTEQQEAKLLGENLKMMPDQSVNISSGKYTVCDHEHPLLSETHSCQDDYPAESEDCFRAGICSCSRCAATYCFRSDLYLRCRIGPAESLFLHTERKMPADSILKISAIRL